MLNTYQVAQWASTHPHTARAIIVACHMYIYLASIALGIVTASLGISIQISLFWIAFGVLISCCSIYPGRRWYGQVLATYHLRARYIMVILAASVVMIVSLTNFEERRSFETSDYRPVPVVYQSGSYQERSALKEIRKVIRQGVRDQLQKIIPDPSAGDKVAFSIALGIGLFLGFILIAYLSCAIACSVGTAFGVLAFIGGIALLTFLGILGYRGIWGGKEGVRKRNRVNHDSINTQQRATSGI